MRINFVFLFLALLLSSFVFAAQEKEDDIVQKIQDAGDHETYTFQVRKYQS